MQSGGVQGCVVRVTLLYGVSIAEQFEQHHSVSAIRIDSIGNRTAGLQKK